MASPFDFLNGGKPPYQDYIMLGGQQSPGLATPVKAGSPRNWDKRAGYGLSGATLVYTGDDLSEFDVIIDLWEDAHWSEWATFAKKVLTKPPIGTRPMALGIQHPLLSMAPLNITEVVVKDVYQFEQDEFGMWTGGIAFSVYRAPKPVLGKPLGAIPSVQKPIPTAHDAADVEISRLLTELKGLQ